MKRVAFIYLCLFASAVACQRASRSGASDLSTNPAATSENDPPSPTVEPRLEEQALRRWESATSRIGRSCTHDRDCFSPLRCSQDGACIEPAAMTGHRQPEGPIVLCYGRVGEAAYPVELAADPDQRRRGLMHRPWMAEEWGMLFLYPEVQPDPSFWMANTFISLDMVFLDSDGLVVGVIERAIPLDRNPRSVGRPSQFVLEINAGQASLAGIESGVRCEFLDLPDDLTIE